MDRKATAVWQGGFPQGEGNVSTQSGALKQLPYSFKTRFENEQGTNPEELLAAAHAGCFAMALSAELSKDGIVPEQLEVVDTITIEQQGNGFTITKSHLELTARIPNVDKAKFDAAVHAAKTGCPVSKLFKAEITLNAHLV